MAQIQKERQEDRHERSNRIAREYIETARIKRENKTSKLRALRLQKERESGE
jgi:hypothetical protein